MSSEVGCDPSNECGNALGTVERCESAAAELGLAAIATVLSAVIAPGGCFTTADGSLYFNKGGSSFSSAQFAKSLCELNQATNLALPKAKDQLIHACGKSRLLPTYDVQASQLDAAVRKIASNCRGCAIRIANGTASLSKDLPIGGLYDKLDMVIVGQPWQKSSQPLVTWSLNHHHIALSTGRDMHTSLCLENMLIKDGKVRSSQVDLCTLEAGLCIDLCVRSGE